MGIFLSESELEQVEPAENAFHSPVPTTMISNGEFNPLPQSEKQKRVEARIKELADFHGARQGLNRRDFLRTSSGMAVAFLAMNEVFGNLFSVSEAEAAGHEVAEQRAMALRDQFIFDVQTHFVHDGYTQEGILGLAGFAKENWNPALGDVADINIYKFENYVRQIFLNSDTKISLLSGAPFDDSSWEFLTNDAIKEAVKLVNGVAGSRRMLGHALATPGQPGWMDKAEHAISLRPDSWKMYTIGDPLSAKTKYPWRLDDEKLVYPFYEKAVAAGINTICIHKGLMPADYEQSWAGVWRYNTPWDIGQAAKDWPQINFVIYHGGLRAFLESPEADLAKFESPGEILWASELARIPEKFGVNSVYAEMGTSFANSATANPRFAAAVLGSWIKGLGDDHVVWGTDSVLYGSPQWQIEAFRRFQIPEALQEEYGYAAITDADRDRVFGLNVAGLYGVDVDAAREAVAGDAIQNLRAEYREAGAEPSNTAYGWVRG